MRVVSIIAVLLLIAANALALLPEASAFQSYLSGGALALGLVVLGTILAGRSPKDDTGSAAAEAARPAPVPTHASQADAEIVNFLATLQARGRLCGCKAALQEHFRIRPVREESEGSIVRVAAGYPADEYRLLGKISGPAPFSGVLVHHGWKTEAVKLPRILRSSTDRLPAIAPAEVELK